MSFIIIFAKDYNQSNNMDVKRVIKEKRFTLEKVSNELGITRVTLSQNLSRNPTVKTLQKIAEVIGCNVGDFFNDEEKTIICPHCGKPIKINVELKK